MRINSKKHCSELWSPQTNNKLSLPSTLADKRRSFPGPLSNVALQKRKSQAVICGSCSPVPFPRFFPSQYC